MKNYQKLSLFLFMTFIIPILFSLFNGSLSDTFAIAGVILLSIGVGFTATLGAMLAIDTFKGGILFNDDKLIAVALSLIIKKFNGDNSSIRFELEDSRAFYIIPSRFAEHRREVDDD